MSSSGLANIYRSDSFVTSSPRSPTPAYQYVFHSQAPHQDLDQEDYEYLRNRSLNAYQFLDRIGEGSYGCVYRGVRLDDQQQVAIKLMKVGLRFCSFPQMDRETEITGLLMEFPHLNILTTYEIMRIATRTYFINQLSMIGNLFNLLQVTNDRGIKVWRCLREFECRHLITGIARGLSHMHSLGAAHGDVKLENVLLFWNIDPCISDQYNTIRFDRLLPKLIDFSNSKIRDKYDPIGQILFEMPSCTINYAAPESYINSFGFYDMISADVFSLGCCLLAMLLGARPYNPPMDYPNYNEPNFNRKRYQYENLCSVMKNSPKYTANLCKGLAQPLKQVLLKLLEPVPESRSTIKEFLNDKWIRRPDPREFEEIFGQLSYMNGSLLRDRTKRYAKDY